MICVLQHFPKLLFPLKSNPLAFLTQLLWWEVHSLIACIRPMKRLNPPAPGESPSPQPLLDPRVMLCIACTNSTNKIRDTEAEVKCAGSTSRPQSARCTLPGHWSDGATFSQVFFHPGPSSETTQNTVAWVTWIAARQTLSSVSVFVTRQVNSRSPYHPVFSNQLAHPTLVLMIVQRLDNGQAAFS